MPSVASTLCPRQATSWAKRPPIHWSWLKASIWSDYLCGTIFKLIIEEVQVDDEWCLQQLKLMVLIEFEQLGKNNNVDTGSIKKIPPPTPEGPEDFQ